MAQETNPIFEHFHAVPVSEVLGDKKIQVLTLKTTNSVEQAVKLFGTNKILSAPVLNEKDEFVGFVDMLDILKYITKAAPSEWSIKQDELQSLKIAGRAISLVPVSQVVDLSGRDPMMIVQASAPASNLIKIFAHGFHRVAVFDKEKLVSIVSQSDAVRFLSKSLHMGKLKNVGQMTLKELNYASAQVETAPKGDRVLDVLKKMADKVVGQLAIVDENGRLFANFSASDVRGLYQEKLPSLLETAQSYLEKHSPNSLKPICGLPSSKLVDIVNELTQSKLHHLWVVDEFKPVGVISLTDIMKIGYQK